MITQHNEDVMGRVARMEGAIGEIRDAVKIIAPAIVQLATLETKHLETRESLGRAFKEIDELDIRVTLVERDMPVVKLVSNWVQRAVVAVLGVVGLAVLALVVYGK